MAMEVDIRNISFQYGNRTILDNVSLTIKAGSFTSIIGPNGSGKSTLLKNISASLKPNRGTVMLGERDVGLMTSKEIARHVAVVPQETHVAFSFSVFDIVMMGRSPYLRRFQKESPADFQIVRQAMEQTGTWGLKDRPIDELSGGERQRVIIARALAQAPTLILLDEPTSHLDIQHQIEILELLETLCKEKGLTVVAVLHDMNLAARYSSDLVLLKNGKIVEVGNAEQVITYENLKKVYAMEMIIERNPFTGTPYMIPLFTRKEKKHDQS
ncbi:heme ABC transporter ATP-binding protein [Thermotalea metallivorans]|uniref:Putative siderophore transport system ATP-binding protein YusV n=1 Tax=Thermotalea metallivorans TaxID=520762 RepID=A0A140LEE6_9FIRM|nr:heme ABC transporter ATP-binding protein [Thermotalea metallivorans]KXG78921.1 putative siderophore transport system ATP-binding protein YusV [Thermotalea metallivorans]